MKPESLWLRPVTNYMSHDTTNKSGKCQDAGWEQDCAWLQ